MPSDVNQKSIFSYAPANGLLDDTNICILRELRNDPRLTMAELGRRVNMSSPAVTERVRRMEEAGVIVGYYLDINPAPLGLPITAYVRIRPNREQFTRVADFVRQIPEIVECHRITGEDCFIMKVHIPSMDQLDRLLDRLVVYGMTITSIVQSSPVPLRPVPLPER